MQIDQYNKKTNTRKTKSVPIEAIFENIRTNNINTPKTERKGNVFSATTKLGRQHKDLETFTGLLFMDMDKCLDHEAVKEFFIELEHTVAVWYSSSGTNVHALIKIPVSKDIDEFKRRHKAFLNKVKPYINDLAIIDSITSNPFQLAFESYDPDIFVNDNPIQFTEIKRKPPVKKKTKVITMPSTKAEEWCIDWIKKSIEGINTNGYPQLLKYAQTLGGYSSGGNISQTTAEETLKQCIEANAYFNSSESQGTIRTYLKGGLDSFRDGLKKPLEWK